MNIYTSQLKQSIQQKLELINDEEYLSSLDAILTFETYGQQPTLKPAKKSSFWKRFFATYLKRT